MARPHANRLEISFNTRGETVDRTTEMMPEEDVDAFLRRCLEEVSLYLKFEWGNRYRLRGEVETDWLSEGSMFDFLRERGRGGPPTSRRP